jgi:DNA adenine methylase
MRSKLLPILEAVPHRRYCEPFGGGASLLLAKTPVEVETYNDLDGRLHNFFTVLADPDLFEEFHRRVAMLPYSRRVYAEARDRDMTTGVDSAVAFFTRARQSFSGKIHSGWSMSKTESSRGMASTCSGWLSILDMLPEIHARLQRVQIECNDWRKVLRQYDTSETLFYLDPPYVHATREATTRYDHEMTDDDHVEMVGMLLELEGHAALSGYDHPIYNPLIDAGWTCHRWDTSCDARGRTCGMVGTGSATRDAPRTECLWVSPGTNGQATVSGEHDSTIARLTGGRDHGRSSR